MILIKWSRNPSLKKETEQFVFWKGKRSYYLSLFLSYRFHFHLQSFVNRMNTNEGEASMHVLSLKQARNGLLTCICTLRLKRWEKIDGKKSFSSIRLLFC